MIQTSIMTPLSNSMGIRRAHVSGVAVHCPYLQRSSDPFSGDGRKKAGCDGYQCLLAVELNLMIPVPFNARAQCPAYER